MAFVTAFEWVQHYKVCLAKTADASSRVTAAMNSLADANKVGARAEMFFYSIHGEARKLQEKGRDIAAAATYPQHIHNIVEPIESVQPAGVAACHQSSCTRLSHNGSLLVINHLALVFHTTVLALSSIILHSSFTRLVIHTTALSSQTLAVRLLESSLHGNLTKLLARGVERAEVSPLHPPCIPLASFTRTRRRGGHQCHHCWGCFGGCVVPAGDAAGAMSRQVIFLVDSDISSCFGICFFVWLSSGRVLASREQMRTRSS